MREGPPKFTPKVERPKSVSAPMIEQIEISSGFSEGAKEQTAGRILDQVRNGVDRWLLEKPLYLYLTQRVSDAELDTIEKSFEKIGGKEKYRSHLQKTQQEASTKGLTVDNDMAWFSIYKSNPSARKKERMARTSSDMVEAVDIAYKEYFTVPVESKDTQSALTDIGKFQDVLPNLAQELADLSQTENDYIKLKVPGNLQSFIKHPDSLVIHYRNPALSEKIRQIVDRHLGAAGLETTRENRTASGFDFDSDKELYAGSHSSLMASVAADKIIEAVKNNPRLGQASPSEFVPFLDKAFAEYAQLKPNELLSRLDKVKS